MRDMEKQEQVEQVEQTEQVEQVLTRKQKIQLFQSLLIKYKN